LANNDYQKNSPSRIWEKWWSIARQAPLISSTKKFYYLAVRFDDASKSQAPPTHTYTAATTTIRATHKTIHIAASSFTTDQPRHATTTEESNNDPCHIIDIRTYHCPSVTTTTNSDASTYIMLMTLQYHHLPYSSIATTTADANNQYYFHEHHRQADNSSLVIMGW